MIFMTMLAAEFASIPGSSHVGSLGGSCVAGAAGVVLPQAGSDDAIGDAPMLVGSGVTLSPLSGNGVYHGVIT